MTKLNYWNETWSLDEVQCPCDLDFVAYLNEKAAKDAAIFHFGTGNHHIVGLRMAENGSNCAVLGITASPQEYDDYIDLLITNPRLGFTYKALFGDIYQLDPRLLIHRPRVIILDDALSALEEVAQSALIARLRMELPEATVVSLAQRPAPPGGHDRQLMLQRRAGRPILVGGKEPV